MHHPELNSLQAPLRIRAYSTKAVPSVLQAVPEILVVIDGVWEVYLVDGGHPQKQQVGPPVLKG